MGEEQLFGTTTLIMRIIALMGMGLFTYCIACTAVQRSCISAKTMTVTMKKESNNIGGSDSNHNNNSDSDRG